MPHESNISIQHTNENAAPDTRGAINPRVKFNEEATLESELEFLRAFMSINAIVSGYFLDLKANRSYAIGQEAVYANIYDNDGDWSHREEYIKKYVHTDDQQKIAEALRIDYIREHLKKEQSYSVDVRDHASGSERWLRFTIMRCTDEDHAALYVRDTTSDVLALQEQKRLNHLLQEQQVQLAKAMEQEKEYNDIMSDAGFGIWHIYLKDGVTPRMQANQKMVELLGIDSTNMTEEEIYDAWYDRITPDAIPSVQKSVGEMMEGKFSENTYLWNHPANGDIYVRCGGTCVKLPDGTNMLRGYHADVTEIVREKEERETALQRKNEEITTLNDELQAQIGEIKTLNSQLQEERTRATDAYGMIEGLSREFHTIWLVNKETSRMRLVRSSGVSTIKNAVQMGKDFPAFDAGFDKYINTYIMPEDRERMHREIAFAEILRQLEKNDHYSVNYLRKDDSGHVGYHQIAFANADTADGKKQFVYGFRDIDQMVKEEQKQKEELRKAKEDAEAANDAKTSFLFNMSHDIRTPMNAIMGFRDLLEKHQEDPARRQDYLTKIEDSSKILLSIINNVLEMARIEKGTLEIDESAWSAEQFNDTLYSVFRDMMQQKGLKFTRQIDVKNNYVFCDPIKLREIFINILSNAYKYTNAGGKVHMHLEEIPSNREGWVLYQTTISDTGIGMSKEFLPHIFDEFARESNSTETKIEGTGLGMPIVKRLVEMLDGTIEVQSEKGKGSKFIVKIPHRISDKSNLVDHAGVEVDPKLFKGKRILLAEDNDLNAEIATEILGEAGFIVERANDGVICCDMLGGAPADYYDVILMDIQMPRMNGYEATRTIRSMSDHSKSALPILAMTANAFEEDKREAMRAGMNGHLAKPINVSELLKQLAFVLG